MIKTATISIAVILGTIYSANAQQNSSNWKVSLADGACWASSSPSSSDSSFDNRSIPYLSIQNHPSEGVKGSIAASNGGVDASQMKAVIVVDDKEFNTLTYREAAFVGTGKPEADLTAAMQRGKEAKVIWTSKDGKTAVDRYDLTGFTSAKNDIDRSCK